MCEITTRVKKPLRIAEEYFYLSVKNEVLGNAFVIF